MVVQGQERSMRFQHQRESMVPETLGKGAIDRDRLSAALQGRLAFFDFHRNMPVDNQSLSRVDAELGEDLFTKPCLVDQAEIGVFRFEVGALVRNQTAFEGGDAVFPEEWRLRTAPEIPEQIEIFPFPGVNDAVDD